MTARRKPTTKPGDDGAENVETGPGYHGQAASDRGYDHRPEDVGTFGDHLELDADVTVHHGDEGPSEVNTDE